MTFRIVPTSEEMIEQFWQVLDSVAKEKKYISFFKGPPFEKLQTFVLNNIKLNAPQFLAISDDKAVGWCDIKPNEKPAHLHCGELGIGLLEGYRDQGIGTALMQTSLDKAREIGLKRISLTVFKHNTRAKDFYKKFGFQQEGILRKASLIDGQYIDVIAMALIFDA